MHVCPECSSPLVQPVDWRSEGTGWWVLVRCPECEHRHSGVYAARVVEAYDNELDKGTASLTAALAKLTQLNMSEELDLLHAALAADAVLPEDFR